MDMGGRKAVVAVALVALGGTLAACGGSSDEGKKQPERSANVAFTPNVDTGLKTDVDLHLIGHRESRGALGCSGKGPVPWLDIGRGGEGKWCVRPGEVDPYTDFTYEILGTRSIVWGYSKVPHFGKNELKCEIRKAGTYDQDFNSPYRCDYRFLNSDSMNPVPYFWVVQKPTEEIVIDGSNSQEDLARFNRASAILNDNCGDNQPGCTWTAKTGGKIIAAPRTKWQLFGSPQPNCYSPTPEPHTISATHTLSWSDTFGIRAGVKFGPKLVSGSIDASYSHTIQESRSFTETHTQNVQPGKVGAFYVQPGYVEIFGDFLVGTRDKAYSIKNMTFDFPIADEYIDKAHPLGDPIEPQVVHPVQRDAGCTNKEAAPRGSPQQLEWPEIGLPPDATVG